MSEAWTTVAVPGDTVAPPSTARKPGFHWMDAVMILDVVLLAALFIPEIINAFRVVGGEETGAFQVTQGALWIQAGILFTLLGAIPFLWVLATRIDGWQGTIEYFGLRRPGINIAWGLVGALGLLVMLFIIGLIAMALGQAPENPAVSSLQPALSWGVVIALSLAAGVGEEVLFRGVLQKHIGWIGQAFVFGALHAYQGVYGIVLTLLLGLLFGYVVRRGWGLWIPISAHFFFDLIQLSLLKLLPDVA